MMNTRHWGKRRGPCACGVGGKIPSECCLPWEEAFQRLASRMIAFATTPAIRGLEREAESIFTSMDEEGEEAGKIRSGSRLRFQEWFLCDYTASRRRAPLLATLADEAPDLPSSEALLLLALLLSPVRAYEVSESLGPQGVILKDLLVGSERRAGPFGLPSGLIRSDIVIGRFLSVGRLWRPGLTVMRLAAPARSELLAYVRTAYQLARPGRHVSVEDFLDGAPHLYHHFYQLRGDSLAGQEVHTVRVVAYAPGRVRFEGADTAHIRAVLNRQPDLEPVVGSTPNHYSWIQAGDGVCRATVTLDERGVELQADTQADLAEAHAVFARALQGLVHDEGAKEVVPLAPSTSVGGGTGGTAGVAFLNRAFATWTETALPLLSDRTPVEACRSRAGRQEVAALLVELERDLARQKRLGRAWVDITWLRNSLGLTEPMPGAPGSGADRGSAGAAAHPGEGLKPKRRGSGEHRASRSRR